MRDLATIIASIIAVLPDDEIEIRERLKGLADTVAHTPPEVMLNRWHDLDMLIIDLASPHYGKDFPDWLTHALNIWKDME